MIRIIVLTAFLIATSRSVRSQYANALPVQSQKPPLRAQYWLGITGKPLSATAGALIFAKGGNAIDASCAMLAASCTMFDVLSWGGEMQGLIYHPHEKKVIGINGLGIAPAKATVDFYKEKGYERFPPDSGPLAAVTPGIPGTLMEVLAKYGTMSLKDVLTPAISLANGYPIEGQTANAIERNKEKIKSWYWSKKILLPHLGEKRESPQPGEIFRQPELKATLEKLIEAESIALAQGKSREAAIMAAYDRFYKGDIARDFVSAVREEGGIISEKDLADWNVKFETPLSTNYKGIDVYKLREWTQGPVFLQALNMLELIDLKSLGFNSAEYIHTLYQVMNLVFADRDFYYGDPAFHPDSPIETLISKEYAQSRLHLINHDKNDTSFQPGDPYSFVGKTNPFAHLLVQKDTIRGNGMLDEIHQETFNLGTTTIVATDTSGWVVSFTPSGGWIPTCIAGSTGIGLSQRMQSFVLNEIDGPSNVLAPGKRPRVTLTPTLAMKDGKPFLAFAKQGGDEQDQLLLQFFMNVVEFDFPLQSSTEAPNFKTYQMFSSFGQHERKPGALILNVATPYEVQKVLESKGYNIQRQERTSGPINAIYFDWRHHSFWGGSSNHGEDYGIGW